jgi:HEAT repeat protein
LPRLVELLQDDDPELSFAAAYSLLHAGSPELTGRVLGAFEAAGGDGFRALAAALAHAPLPRSGLERVRALLSARPAMRAVAAAEVLAFHGALGLAGEQLRYFLEDEDAATRRAAWRLAALLGAQVAPESYAGALRDEDPGVGSAALECGAWCGVQGVLPALRRLAADPRPERLGALYLLAVLGSPEDAQRIHALLGAAALGPDRFGLAGAFGDPRFVPLVVGSLEDPDPAAAAAAGAAFTRLTGVDVESSTRATVPPADGAEPDDFEAEFLERVMLPDPAKARREWERLRPALERAGRLCRGMDVARPLDAESAARLDMRSRREVLLRLRFAGGWTGTPLALEVFPQGR